MGFPFRCRNLFLFFFFLAPVWGGKKKKNVVYTERKTPSGFFSIPMRGHFLLPSVSHSNRSLCAALSWNVSAVFPPFFSFVNRREYQNDKDLVSYLISCISKQKIKRNTRKSTWKKNRQRSCEIDNSRSDVTGGYFIFALSIEDGTHLFHCVSKHPGDCPHCRQDPPFFTVCKKMKQTKGVGFEGGIRGRSHTSPWEKKRWREKKPKGKRGVMDSNERKKRVHNF